MLLYAVSVLVVTQSSSEIPEGLMNNPVYQRITRNVAVIRVSTLAQTNEDSRRYDIKMSTGDNSVDSYGGNYCVALIIGTCSQLYAVYIVLWIPETCSKCT